MKKSLIALAVLASSGAAMAQSSVTLYGLVDAYVGHTSTTVAGVKLSQNAVNSSGLNGSRWGLKGSEDLGSGMKAVFVLENGFSTDTGGFAASNAAKSSLLFGRQAFVGLDSSSFGSVSLGRQYGAYEPVRAAFLSAQGDSPAFDATNSTRPSPASSGLAGIGAWVGYQLRIDNSIRYATPNISGFQAAVVYGLGEDKTATTSATKNSSFSLTYANGPVAVALVHQDDEVVVASHVKNTAIGGNYDFGVAKAFLAYNRADNVGVKSNEWSIGTRVPLGATTLVAQFAQSKQTGQLVNLKNQSLGLSAEYSLSKRTTAYAGFNKTNLNSSAIKDDVFGLGIRHTF
jgi:predicted porin